MTAPIPADVRARIVADYAAGMSQSDTANKYGVAPASVHRIVKAAGVERGRKLTKDILDAAVEDYLHSGESIRAVAKRHPISDDTLRTELKARELTRPSGATVDSITKAAAIDDFVAGMSIAAISKKHGVGRSTISAWLRQEDVGADDREHRSPAIYEGGWVSRGGVMYPRKVIRGRDAA